MEEKLVGLNHTISQMEESARSKVEEQINKEEGEEQKNAKDKAAAASEKSTTEERKDHHKADKEDDSNPEDPTMLSSPSGNVPSGSVSSESGPDQSSKDSSWASDQSAMSSETPGMSAANQATLPEPLEGDASNGRLELKTIWFYFASPPPISIHKKVDYTR